MNYLIRYFVLLLFGIFFTPKITAQSQYYISNFAGTGIIGSADGPGATASFRSIYGVAVDENRNVYIADAGNNKIRKVSPAGLVSTFAGSVGGGSTDGPALTARFRDPYGIAVDSIGNVYVADSGNNKIRKISPTGIVSTLAGSGNQGATDETGDLASFYFPFGLAVDRNGYLYVADTNNNKIRKISPTGIVSTLAGSGASGSANGPGALASFLSPRGIAVDTSGNVYVADAGNQIIRKISPDGVVDTFAGVAGSRGSTNGIGVNSRFDFPTGVALDSSDNVYVSDTGNHKIRKISQAALVTTIAGSGIIGGVNGNGAIAQFSYPQAVAVDNEGSFYVTTPTPIDGSDIRKGIVLQSQTISFPQVQTIEFSKTLFSPSANSSSGLPVTFSVVGGPATVSGNSILFTGIGTVSVRASQAGNATCAAATVVDQSFVVTQGPQIINFSSLSNRSFSQTPFDLFASATSGFAVSFQVVSGPATISGSSLTMTGLGLVVLRATQAGGGEYVAAMPVNQSFSVTQGMQTIVFDPPSSRTFGQAPFQLSARSSSNLPVAFQIVSGPATISGSTCTLTGVGNVVVRSTQLGNTNYSAASPVEQSFTIAKASQTLSFGSLPTKNPTDLPFELTASSSSELAPLFSVVSGPATVSGNLVTLTGSGTAIIRASQPGNENYQAAANVDQSFLVRNSQTISFSASAARPLSVAPIPLSATSTSGLAVSFSLISGPATLSGNSLSLTGTGTLVIKATQAGNATIAPAPEVTVFMTVTPNTAAPIAIALSKSYFFDNVPNPSELAIISAVDPDAGDSLTYSLVSGTGSTDNAKFTIVGDRLRSATNFNYNTQRYLSIRVRVTDSAGQSYEQVVQLQTIPRNPNARFIPGNTFPAPQNYVNSIFQLVGKSSGRGINYPKAFFDSASPDFQRNLFQAFEAASVSADATAVPQNESYFQVAKMDEVKTTVRTILLIDNSSSISFADLAVIKSAAKIVVDKMFEEQEIAIYSFSGTHNLVANFTGKSAANQVSLKNAIDSIVRGSPTTNLYGSMLAMLNLTEWRESFSQAGIETGFLVVLTDGQDTSGAVTEASVIAKRNFDEKRIYTIGLGANIDTASLNRLQNTNLPLAAANSSKLAEVFEQVQDDIIDLANSFYWVNYSSPKRLPDQSLPPAERLRRLEVKVHLNTNFASDGILSRTFDSQTFNDLPSALYINRKANLTEGISSLSISKDSPASASAITVYPQLDDNPSYTWNIGNPTLAILTPQGAAGERVIITPNNLNGTTTLTVTDITNNLPPKTIQLLIGTGLGLPTQQITFPALANRLIGDAPFILSASASSGLPVKFSIVSGPASLGGDGKTLTPTGEGTITVRASQAGNASFAPASPVDRSFTVSSNPALTNLTAAISAAGLTGPQATPNGIPFSDGVPNLLKYAFNMNLAGPDVKVLPTRGTSGLPKVTTLTNGPSPILAVEFLRRKGSGLIYTPQRSISLGSFSPMTGTQTITSIDAQWERVSVEEAVPPATSSSAFARVQVSLP